MHATHTLDVSDTYTLLGPDGEPYESTRPGRWGGHRGQGVYGRLDCPSALSWIARGHYTDQRVFFRSEADAVAAGYRPCGSCCRERYARWKVLVEAGKGPREAARTVLAEFREHERPSRGPRR